MSYFKFNGAWAFTTSLVAFVYICIFFVNITLKLYYNTKHIFLRMNRTNKPIVVNLGIGDQLTSISCGHIVVELIKFIAYQRLQIPYTYQWLKQVVNKKKACENEDVKDSFQSERHFRAASTALENLDFILKVCFILSCLWYWDTMIFRVILKCGCLLPCSWVAKLPQTVNQLNQNFY